MLDSYTPFSYLIISLTLSYLILPIFIRVLLVKNILDRPSFHKIHSKNTPTLGGLIIILSAIFTILFFFPIEELREYRYLILSIVLMAIIGLRDDLIPLKPIFKIITQVIPIVLIASQIDNILLTSLYNLWEIQDFPIAISYLITIFTIVIISNSFNLIDGIDGLSASLSSISLITFSLVLFDYYPFYSYFLLSFTGALLGFLFFNWHPAKIFMGDTGALTVGLLLAVSALITININFESSNQIFQGGVASTMCIIAVPLFDTFRVIILRLIKRKSPLTADDNHLHHSLLRLGFGHKKATITLVLLQVALILVAIIASDLNNYLVFAIMGFVFLGFLITLNYLNRKTKTKKGGV